ncbi:hypothetical protein CR513_07146, partial [Mucuna pruriens]
MKTWRWIAPNSRTCLKRSKKASKNMPKDGASWQHRETVTIFIDTLPTLYYDKVVGNITSNFIDLVVVGERIELGIRHGKFIQTSSNVGFAKKPTFEKKGETNAMLVELVFPQGKTNAPSYPT